MNEVVWMDVREHTSQYSAMIIVIYESSYT